MLRSLWTAATGMAAQQINVDTISNNLANINTTGYKKETTEFKSLLYQTIQENSTDSEGNPKPVGVQVGLGVRNSAITTRFDQGTITATENALDLAIEGPGFFMVQQPDGSVGYVRGGSFTAALKDGGVTIADSNGNPLLDINQQPIVFDASYNMGKISIDEAGRIGFPDASGNPALTEYQIGVVQFSNPAGLTKLGGGIYAQSVASGEPRFEIDDEGLSRSAIRQKYLEASNVSAVDEMVNLIVAQRAYEMNSKIITASDTMLQQANNLRS